MHALHDAACPIHAIHCQDVAIQSFNLHRIDDTAWAGKRLSRSRSGRLKSNLAYSQGTSGLSHQKWLLASLMGGVARVLRNVAASKRAGSCAATI